VPVQLVALKCAFLAGLGLGDDDRVGTSGC